MSCPAFICRDARMADIAARARKTAGGAANILIEGASGTGRSTLARYIHACAGHAAGSLMTVHCAAGLPHDIAAAGDATLLLVDVCELDAQAQAELASALVSGARRGGRLIATASASLPQARHGGVLSDDLFYRLGVIRFHLPALAERPDDVPALAAHFTTHFARAHRRAARRIADDAMAKLAAYHWPGNVQELENVVHRAVLFAEAGTIGADDIVLPNCRDADHADAVSAALVGRTVAEVERDLILQTLRRYGGNRTQAADILGISVRTLRNKIRQYLEDGADVPAFSRAA